MSSEWVQLANLACGTTLASVVESCTSHTSFNQTRANSVDANVGLLQLIDGGLCDGIHPGYTVRRFS